MAIQIKRADGSETVVDNKGEFVSENPSPDGVVEVEALMSHQSRAGQFCPGPKDGEPGGRYFESTVRAMDLVSRGIVKLVDSPASAPESKMAEAEDVKTSSPVKHEKGKK